MEVEDCLKGSNMKKFVPAVLGLFLIAAFALQKCQPGFPLLPTATPLPTARPASSAAVLAACPVSSQQKAMHPAFIPNWESLGLFACYDIALDLSTVGPFIGSETLVFTNPTPETLSDVVLRTFPNAPPIYGGEMNILAASVGDQPVTTEVLLADRSALRLLLNQPLLPGQTAVIRIQFSLSVPQGFKSESTYGVFSQSSSGDLYVLANWFPILAVRAPGAWQIASVLPGGDAVTSHTALFQAAITTPTGWKVAATGVEIAAAEKNGTVQHHWVSGPVRDFFLAASPDFEMREINVGEIQLRQWGTAKTNPGTQQALETAQTALEYYQKTFGAYPFTELDIVAVPLQYASGVEFPGIILITENAYVPNSRAGLLQVVVAHEIAHQWWYSLIGNDVLKDPWQDEGLTTYSTYAYLRAQGSPIYPFLKNDYQERVSAYTREHNAEASIAQPLSAFFGREGDYSTLIYVRAALFFDEVRQQMGNASFEAALQQYYSTYQYQLVPPQALLAAFNTACRCDLSSLYQKYGVAALNP